MGKLRKPRSDAKMYQLPKDIQHGVHERLIDCNMSYADIRAWLAEKGYAVSQSSLSRYAFKVFEAAQRVADDLEKTKLVQVTYCVPGYNKTYGKIIFYPLPSANPPLPPAPTPAPLVCTLAASSACVMCFLVRIL